MNLCLLLWLLLLPFLSTGYGGIYNVDLSTVEVPTDDLHSEADSGLKIYSTGSKINPFSLLEPSDDEEQSFLGTTFFQGPRKDCFTLEEIALLRARQGFELLVPKSYPKHQFNNGLVLLLVRYWNAVNQIVYQMSDQKTERLLEDSFYDTLGAYCRYYLLPVAQVSYYAGHVSLNTMEHLGNIKRECHDVLNTNGDGWRMPPYMNITEQLQNVEIEPTRLEMEAASHLPDGSNICDHLDLGSIGPESVKGQLLLPLPKLDPLDSKGHLTNIFLPFRDNIVCSWRSSNAATELKRFVGTVNACHSLLKLNPTFYNRKLLEWMQDFVPLHMLDEQFYAGLGGILQLQESLVKTVQVEAKDHSGKMGRSIPLWREEDEKAEEKADDSPYLNEKIYVGATIVLTVVFLIVVFALNCGRIFTEKKQKEDKTPLGSEDLELGEISIMSKPKRSKREKKVTIETPMSPLKVTSERRYYGHLARSVSTDDCSTSTLGYQFKQKIMPFRFDGPADRVRKSYKYATLEEDLPPCSERQRKETKKSGRGK